MPLPKQPSDNDEQPNDDEQAVGAAPTAMTSRNFAYMRPDAFKRGNVIIENPPYITSQASPVKPSASHPATGQEQTRAVVDQDLRDELGGARIRADDLIDQMFGSIISLDLALRVLEGLMEAGKVVVRDPHEHIATDTTAALEEAYERARAHACKHDGVEVVKTPSKKGKGAQVDWQWEWIGYPSDTVHESEIVDYFNEIIDAALALPCLVDLLKERQALYRFAIAYDRSHAFPLAFGTHEEDMRPDFVVMPLRGLQAHEPATPGGAVKYRPVEEYSNFTMLRLCGECKKSDHNSATTQVQRYMRGTKRSQPWQRFTTAMTVTQKMIGFMRGEGTGIERVSLQLDHGRASIELVRLLLGVVLADEETFGKSRYFELAEENQMLETTEPQEAINNDGQPDSFRRSARIRAREEGQGSGVNNPDTHQNPGSQHHLTSGSKARSSQSQQVATAAAPTSRSHASRSSQKRKRNNDDDDYVDSAPAKKKSIKSVIYTVLVPKKAFGYVLKGVVFNAASIRGRGTVVWVGEEDGGKLVALKLSWQDVARKAQRDKVLDILSCHRPHGNVLLPTGLDIEEDSTLRTIRNFTPDEVRGWAALHQLEDRVLEVHVIDFARPMMFFWSVQDFVLGLHGALLGHEYLVSIGILHRDISENNILLALLPGPIRGYITDFDMAIPYPTQTSPPTQSFDPVEFMEGAKPSQLSDSLPPAGPFKAERTGTTPYMSVNVLNGLGHTHYDDIESFLYVLVLFFVTYNRPLPEADLANARSQGYTQAVMNGPWPHIEGWPDKFKHWRTDHSDEAKVSFFQLDRHAMIFSDTVLKRWKDKSVAISIAKLFKSSRALFKQKPERRVSHQEFIAVLDEWLRDHQTPPAGYNSCPFQDSKKQQLV